MHRAATDDGSDPWRRRSLASVCRGRPGFVTFFQWIVNPDAVASCNHNAGETAMLDNEYYSQALHGPYETYDLGDFVLEDGGTIRACTLAYATFGTLAPGRDNAVLVPTWFSGTEQDHGAGLHRSSARARS